MTVQPSPITAGLVAPLADGALDMVALEDRERRLLHRPETPEADSVVEVLAVAAQAIDLLGGMVVHLAELNGIELDLARDLAGFGDRLVAGLRDSERNASAAPLTGRQLATRIRPQLDLLADSAHASRWPQARGALHDLFTVVPADAIFRHTVTRQIGADKTAQLMRLHDAWAKGRSKAKAAA